MHKTITSNGEVISYPDEESLVVIDAAGTGVPGAALLPVPQNFKRVVFLAKHVDPDNHAVAFGPALVGQEVEVHPVGGSIEVFAAAFPSISPNFLDDTPSFTTTSSVRLKGVRDPRTGLTAWSRLG